MSSSTGLGYTNYAKTGTLTAESEAANSSAANLSSDQCTASTGWRTEDNMTSNTTLTLEADASSTWRAFSLVNTNITPLASVKFELFDSDDTSVWDSTVSGPPVGYRQVVALADSDQTAAKLVVSFHDPTNPDSFISVGGMFAGPIELLANGRTNKSAFGRGSKVDEIESWGGQEWPRFRWQKRIQEIDLDGVRDDEVWDLVDTINRVALLGGNVLYIPDISSENLPQEVIYGRLKSTADIGTAQNVVDRHTWAATVTERL
jgi:hypothetical protein